MREFFRRLISSLDPEEAVKHSMLNHHAIGLDYLNLLRTDRLTVKCYIADPGRIVGCGNGDFLVNPHNHAYAFETHVMAGAVKNVDFEVADASCYFSYDKLSYDTVTKNLSRIGSVRLRTYYRQTYSAQAISHYLLEPEEIHTIIPLFGQHGVMVMMLLQYEDVTTETNLFVRPGEKISFDGLYVRPNTDDVRRLISVAKKAVDIEA